MWLDDEDIGELPEEWNWLAIEYPPNPTAKLIHQTLGKPCFSEYAKSEISEMWHSTFDLSLSGHMKR